LKTEFISLLRLIAIDA